ncbi:MAG: hypothetical protein J6Q74_01125 [Clostridia bacterium]|nr:hypothetical protein [Clostridia bacterium]
MENRDFFDTVTEYINEEKGWSRATFNAWAVRCGYQESCIDEYSDEVEYKRILLSHYYHSLLFEDELDFDGKPLSRGPHNETRLLEEIMRRRETVKAYIKWSMSFSSYKSLVEKHNLAT